MKSVPQTPREALLEDLQKFTEYTVRVYAFTRYGNGVASQPILLRTQEDGKLLRLSPICHMSVTCLSRVCNGYTCSTHLLPVSFMIATCLSHVSHMFVTTVGGSVICHPCIVPPHVKSVQIHNICICQPDIYHCFWNERSSFTFTEYKSNPDTCVIRFLVIMKRPLLR